MTDILRLQTLRYALHADATTFTGTPGTLVPLQLTDDGASFLPRNRTPIDRNLRSLSGRRFPHVRGAQDVADITVATEFKGVNANTGAAVTDWEAKMEQGYLLASLFGAVAPATTGAAPTIAAAGHTPASGIVAFTAAANVQNGAVIGFATSSGFQVGRVASGGGATTTSVTLDHPYSGTPTNAATVFRFAVYSVSDSVTQHVHGFFSAEGDNWRRDYFGCAPMSMNLAIPNTGILGMSSVFSPTSFADVAEANPAYADPTAGSPIVSDGGIFRLDGAEFLLRNCSITYNCATAMRETASRANGRLGGVCGTGDGKSFMIEGELYLGASAGATALAELVDSSGTPSINQLLGDSDQAGDVSAVREVALQVGTEAGACVYALLPTADFRASVQAGGAFPVVRFQAMGTGALPAVLAVG
jgi:hypothetical protein